jgi:hypothetical protein
MVATIVAAMLCALALASPATASVEFGDSCAANGPKSEVGAPLYEVANPANTLPTTAPLSGVITKFKVNVAPTPGSAPFKFLALHPLSPTSALVLGEAAGTLRAGANVFDARIPVQAGDRIALFRTDSPSTIICKSPTSKSTIGVAVGDPSPGAVDFISETPEQVFRVPLAAVIEPDADGDGFGDETQDGCPQEATTQAVCPLITINALAVRGRNAVTVLVAVNEAAPVSVTGTVKLGKGKTGRLQAPTSSVTPGPIGKFKLKFPATLKSRLKELRPGQSLRLKISAQATNPAGTVSGDNLQVKLKR